MGPQDPVTLARINAGVQIGGGLLLASGKMPRVASAALACTVVPGSLGPFSALLGVMVWILRCCCGAGYFGPR